MISLGAESRYFRGLGLLGDRIRRVGRDARHREAEFLRRGQVDADYAEVPKRSRVDLGAIPLTTVPRTLLDCVAAHVSPELTEQAVRQARTRGLIDKDETKLLRARMRTA